MLRYATLFSILDLSGRVKDGRNIYLLTKYKW